MKPHIKHKNGELWIFSSKKASLDCMPNYKAVNINGVIAYLNMMKVRASYELNK